MATVAAAVEENCSRVESPRLKLLEYQQVCRLDRVMSEDIRICGRSRSHFPILVIPMHKLVMMVRTKLAAGRILVRDVRLNGGAASYVLQSGAEKAEYNDVDLIFRVDINGVENGSDRVKEAVLHSLQEILMGDDDAQLPACTGFIEDAYIRKMVKVSNEADWWSLITLTNASGHHVELKFVDRMRRQYEFSVDSFQIVLDQLLSFYSSEKPQLESSCYPNILAESVYGPFDMALLHLNKKLIATNSPEQIRGGGLLKYCYLLARGYHVDSSFDFSSLTKYMCSRFFIDFPEIIQQYRKILSYLRDHFSRDDEKRSQFLSILYDVVQESTVCLMGQERKQTLDLISSIAQAEQSAHQTSSYVSFGPPNSHWCGGPYNKHLFRGIVGSIPTNSNRLKYEFPSLLFSPNAVPLIYYMPHIAHS